MSFGSDILNWSKTIRYMAIVFTAWNKKNFIKSKMVKSFTGAITNAVLLFVFKYIQYYNIHEEFPIFWNLTQDLHRWMNGHIVTVSGAIRQTRKKVVIFSVHLSFHIPRNFLKCKRPMRLPQKYVATTIRSVHGKKAAGATKTHSGQNLKMLYVKCYVLEYG